MSGRIPQDFIDQLLDRVDIVDLIDSFLPLKKAGNNYKACCPFHGEKTPSFTVSREKQFYHCFGCGAHGTAISWLMEHDHQEFRDAVETLAGQVGMEVPSDDNYVKTSTKVEGIDLYQLSADVAKFYAQQLKVHPASKAAKDYLIGRGLSGEIAKQERYQKALTQIGLLSKNEKGRIYDRFRNRIMFPIVDYRGRTVGFGGRVMDSGEPKYLNSPETAIFHKGSELYGLYSAKGEIRKLNHALVVEGYMDVIGLAQYGIDHSVAALGTALTQTNMERLFRTTPRFTVCFDGDRAGLQAAQRALENALPLMQDGREIKFLFLPQGEDPDSMVQKIGKDAFLKLSDEAMPLSDFFIQQRQADINLDTLEGRAKFASESKAQLNKLPDSMIKALITDQIARISNISTEQIATPTSNKSSNFKNQDQQRSQSPKPYKQAPVSKVRQSITLLLRNPSLAKIAGDIDVFATQNTSRGLKLFAELVTCCREHPDLNTASLIERFRWHNDFSALNKLSTAEVYEENNEQQQDKFVALIKAIKVDIEVKNAETDINTLLEKPFSSLNEQERELVRAHFSK